MHRTIFDTPVVSTLLRAGSVAFLRFTGWTVEGRLPTRHSQMRTDRRAAYQQLGPALHT
jgi:hypothetical protein